MRCPFCDNEDTKVIDSRPIDDGKAIRRRRECEKCIKRFTTYEKVETTIIMIIKKDGSRQAFDRDKLMNGIERGLNNMMEKEVKSTFLGELVMEQLKDLDEVAYVRFASVYRSFKDVNTFIKEIEALVGKKNK